MSTGRARYGFFLVWVLGATLILFGCSLMVTPIDPDSLLGATWPRRQFQRVVIIVLENQDYDKAIGNEYLGRLAAQGASFREFHGLFHPSYPNYLAMIGGKAFAVCHFNGDAQVNFANEKTIGDRFDEGHYSWRNYAEDFPEQRPGDTCRESGEGLYARKHVPFLSFEQFQKDGCPKIVSVRTSDDIESQFVQDVKNNRLPTYSFYSPNLHNDGHTPGHSDGLKNASRWLEGLFKKIPRDQPYWKGILIIITFDESDNREPTNHIYTVFLGDMVKTGLPPEVLSRPYNHYNVLRTIEDNFGLAPLGDGDRQAKPIADILE